MLLLGPAVPTANAQPRNPQLACVESIRVAERRHGLPPGLLMAISLMESGLHPHAVNLGTRDGARFPARREEALSLLNGALARGGSPMAGCVQVNVAVHARANPAWTLDPERAAEWAAARMAREARAAARDGSPWREAVRRYHGGANADRYLCRLGGALEASGRHGAARQIRRESGSHGAVSAASCDADRRAGARHAAGHLAGVSRYLEVAEAP